jgi:hypothetical protein
MNTKLKDQTDLLDDVGIVGHFDPDIPEVSCIVPAYNEADTIARTIEAIAAEMIRLQRDFEIIFGLLGSRGRNGIRCAGTSRGRVDAQTQGVQFVLLDIGSDYHCGDPGTRT